jgi:hypothetical protein
MDIPTYRATRGGLATQNRPMDPVAAPGGFLGRVPRRGSVRRAGRRPAPAVRRPPPSYLDL